MTHKVSLLKHAHGPNWVIRSPSCYTTMHCWTCNLQGIFVISLKSKTFSFCIQLTLSKLRILGLLQTKYIALLPFQSESILKKIQGYAINLQNDEKPWKYNKNTDFIPTSRHFLVQWLHTKKIPTCLLFWKYKGY